MRQTAIADQAPYLPFVDGLRAVAILSVVAYHVGIPHVTGGFVGVDVFFVISGFLIIRQIVVALETGRFSFVEFWARRALRIVPPYVLVVLACLAVAPFVLVTANEFKQFGYQVASSALLTINFFFLSRQGYFDTTAHAKPLLHLWSLAVEEQFYLVAPVIAAALWLCARRFRGATLRWLILAGVPAVLFIVSLALCIVFTGTGDDRNHAFYLMPMRAWEFLLGGAVALAAPHLPRLPRLAAELAGWIGLALIGLAVFSFSRATAFPSYAALLPVAGAGMLLLAGSAHPSASPARLLACRPVVFVGLVSYSWYLWHWPLLTFGRIYRFERESALSDLLLGAILPFGLAVLTYLLLEAPIRRWRSGRKLTRDWRPISPPSVRGSASRRRGQPWRRPPRSSRRCPCASTP